MSKKKAAEDRMTRRRWLEEQKAKEQKTKEKRAKEQEAKEARRGVEEQRAKKGRRDAAQRQQRPSPGGKAGEEALLEEADRAQEKQVEADELLEAERYKSSPFRFDVVDPDVPIRHNFELVEETVITIRLGLHLLRGRCRRCGEEWLFTTKAWATTLTLGSGPCP